MNDIIENKTFDEIQVGDQASLTRALDREGVEALGIITGNFNLIDLDPGPADTSMFGQGGGQTGWSAALFASLAFDNAIDERAARTKGIKSPVAGKADILVVPDLEAGNMLAKQLTFMAGAAGIVLGARAPIVLTSRADGPQARLASCAVAVLFGSSKPGPIHLLPGRRPVWGCFVHLSALRLEDGEPLLVASSKAPRARARAIAAYADRGQIETLFGCLKTRGFNFEDTHLTDPERLSKLLGLLALAFAWTHRIGERVHDQDRPIPLKNPAETAQVLLPPRPRFPA